MAPRKDYSQDQMKAALDAVARGMAVATAAKTYSVPRTTLLYKSTGKTPVQCRMGPNTILTTNEENLLEQWILSLAKVHHPVTKEQLLDSVQVIIRESKRPNPFTDNRPGRKWYNAFLGRHPILSERVAQNLTPAREKVTEEQLRRWFEEVQEYLTSKNLFDITNCPSRVFNSDESAFYLQPKGDKVIAKKGDKSVYIAGTNDEKENLTVLLTANGAGEFAPPMVVFQYERIPSHIANSLQKNWGIGRSTTGWMCGPTFFEYITNIFVPWLDENKIKRPILLFIDGHVSHMTLHLSQYCSENGIELIALYPNSTHLIQPMDVAVFKPLKLFWKRQVREWHLENNGNKFRKENFGTTFNKALSFVKKETIQNGFKACGISPFNVNNVKFSKISDKMNENTTNIKVQEALVVLETFIPVDKLVKFKECQNQGWSGNMEDTSLFDIWEKMKKQTEQKKTDHEVEKNEEKEVDNSKEIDENIEPGCSGLKSVIRVSPQKIVIHSVHTLSPGLKSSPLEVHKSPLRIIQNTTPLKSTSIKEQIPTPFKKALFWPEDVPCKKRKKEKIPSAITSDQWQQYHIKKEHEKKKKQEEKEKKAEARLLKKQLREQKINESQKKDRKRKRESNSDSSDEYEEWLESGDSLDDVNLEEEVEEEEDLPKLKYNDINVGDFILAQFLGGKRQTYYYRYVCVVEQKNSEEDIQVASLKSINNKTIFKLQEDDVSSIKLDDILEKLPNPEIQTAGDRIKYVFVKAINIFEC